MDTHITIPMARLIELETAEHERDILRTDNAKLAREAHTWSKAAETYAADAERLRSQVAKLQEPTEDMEAFRLRFQGSIAVIVAEERERCAQAVAAVPTHRWVDGSDQWGNPCPAKIMTTRADYIAAIRAPNVADKRLP